jgi:hypothetical protein
MTMPASSSSSTNAGDEVNKTSTGVTDTVEEESQQPTSSTPLTAEQQAENDKEADAIRRRRLEHFQSAVNNQ